MAVIEDDFFLILPPSNLVIQWNEGIANVVVVIEKSFHLEFLCTYAKVYVLMAQFGLLLY